MKLHHTGFVVKDIEKYSKCHPLGNCIAEIFDPIQNAKMALYQNHADVLIELIEPINETAYTWNALMKHGNHFHHFCYTVKDMSVAEGIASDFRMLKVLGPIKAVLFGGLDVVFYYSRNQQIVEFLIDSNHEL